MTCFTKEGIFLVLLKEIELQLDCNWRVCRYRYVRLRQITSLGVGGILGAAVFALLHLMSPAVLFANLGLSDVSICGAVLGSAIGSLLGPFAAIFELELSLWHVNWLERRGKITKKFKKEQTQDLIRQYVRAKEPKPKCRFVDFRSRPS